MTYVGKHRKTNPRRSAWKKNSTAAAVSFALLAPAGVNAIAHADSVTETLLQSSSSDTRLDVRSSIASLKEKIQEAITKVVAPTEGSYTSGFGPRWGTFHDGMDIANSAGTPIYAAAEGVVIDSGPQGGYGNWIRIQHDDDTVTLYGHMQALHVNVGEHVKAGEYIADMGNLGFSTGPHLHFGVYVAGEAIDPHKWLVDNGVTDW